VDSIFLEKFTDKSQQLHSFQDISVESEPISSSNFVPFRGNFFVFFVFSVFFVFVTVTRHSSRGLAAHGEAEGAAQSARTSHALMFAPRRFALFGQLTRKAGAVNLEYGSSRGNRCHSQRN
jgi:hypothetical protein